MGNHSKCGRCGGLDEFCVCDESPKGVTYGAGDNRPTEAFSYANAVVERNLMSALKEQK